MNFYLAGRYEDMAVLREVAFLLVQSGHHVKSRWLLCETPQPKTIEEFKCIAGNDLSDIRDADQFVLYGNAAEPLPVRQGHSVELGYALAWKFVYPKKKGVVIVGSRTDNVFHYHKDITHFQTWHDFLAAYGIVGKMTWSNHVSS